MSRGDIDNRKFRICLFFGNYHNWKYGVKLEIGIEVILSVKSNVIQY